MNKERNYWRGGPRARFSKEEECAIWFAWQMSGVLQREVAAVVGCNKHTARVILGCCARTQRHKDLSTRKRFWTLTPETFWYRVDRSGGDMACWPWKRGRNSRGYGTFGRGKAAYGNNYAHRTAYELHYGAFDKALFVCHRCDNPPCCNPAHLFLGTTTDNVRDMVAKGRHVNTFRRRGDKLTPNDVVAIRNAFANRVKSLSELAAEHAVTRATIVQIVRGETWTTVAGPRVVAAGRRGCL